MVGPRSLERFTKESRRRGRAFLEFIHTQEHAQLTHSGENNLRSLDAVLYLACRPSSIPPVVSDELDLNAVSSERRID